MSRLVWLIPLFPLLGTIVNALFGRLIGHRAHWIAVPALGASFLASCAVFARVQGGETFTGDLFPWIAAGSFKTAITVQVDPLSAVMLLVGLAVLLLSLRPLLTGGVDWRRSLGLESKPRLAEEKNP